MAKPNLDLEVVGMNYRLTVPTIEKLADDIPLHCTLEREPENPHDENAIKVLVTEKPWRKKHDEGMHVGYIARATASVIAVSMDADEWPYNEAWLTEIDTDTGTGTLLLSVKKD